MARLLDKWGFKSEPIRNVQAADRLTESQPMVVVGGGLSGTPKKMKRNAAALKKLGESPVPSRAITFIRDRVCALAPSITPLDGLETEDLQEEIDVCWSILDNPNVFDEDYASFIGQLTEDLVTFDAGAFEYVERPTYHRPLNDILSLEVVPGHTLEVTKAWVGDPNKPRWIQVVGQKKIPLLDRDMEVMNTRKRAGCAYGISPMEIAVDLMDSFLSLNSYQSMVASNAYPAFMLSLGLNTGKTLVGNFRNYWEQDIRGTGRPGIFGGFSDPKSIQTKPITDEGMYLKYEEMLLRLLAFVFKLKPQDLGVERDVNRRQGEVSKEQSDEEAIRPYATILASRFTRRLFPKIAALTNMPKINLLQFTYPSISRANETELAKIRQIDIETDQITIDEARKAKGLDNLDNGLGYMTLTEYRAYMGKEYGVVLANQSDPTTDDPAADPTEE